IIDDPGSYGEYTIKNIVSTHNTATGMRSLNDFKRGSELFFISDCRTYDMNDCHHSSDGSRYGRISDCTGLQLGNQRSTKNFIEIQSIDSEIKNITYKASNGEYKAGVAGVFITDYAYPSEGGDGVGNAAHQSIRVNINNAYIYGVDHRAIRVVNARNCIVSNITAENCLYSAVSVENPSSEESGSVIKPSGNVIKNIHTVDCKSEVEVRYDSSSIICGNIKNEFGFSRVVTDGLMGMASSASNVRFSDQPQPLNLANTLIKDNNFYRIEVTKTDFPELPTDVPYAFKLVDLSDVSTQTIDYLGRIKSGYGDYLYVSVYALRDTSTKGAIIIQELDAAGGVADTSVYQLGVVTEWELKKLTHVNKSEATKYVVVKLAPACSYVGDVSSQGGYCFADLRISRFPI
ncbi:hypothetical protein ISO77_17705, partial [Morganella morganii subsp. morganii]|uniref:hypothetical protein n=1 Tax=Morganella morganii TaxID=582 RepID=UPI001BDA3378